MLTDIFFNPLRDPLEIQLSEAGRFERDFPLLARYREVEWATLTSTIERLEEACTASDSDRLLQLLSELVPENRINVPRTKEARPELTNVH